MKPLIAAVSFAVFAASAFAGEAHRPYEQLVIDRALPDVSIRAADAANPSAFGPPYEQYVVDRALPNIETRRADSSAASGDTRSDRSVADHGSSGSPWANDYNFIAPAL